MSFITAIGTAVPGNGYRQSQLADFIMRAMHLHGSDARRLQTIFRATGIQTRHSVLEDYSPEEGFRFFGGNGSSGPSPSTDTRMEEFRKHAVHLSLRAVEDCLKDATGFSSYHITHLITVSCTGMYAPGLDIDLMKALKLNPTLSRTQINFMGCFAGLTAIRLADSIASAAPANVLIVCCELCSLHFQKENTEDNLLANALFADGAAALLVQSRPSTGTSLQPQSFHSDLAPEGEQDMAWSIGNSGFRMRLSSYVPDILKGSLKPFTDSMLSRLQTSQESITHFVVHPGGKRILESMEQQLSLSRVDLVDAYNVLRDCGNMSSPTILFVLKRLREKLTKANDGEKILCFAFGPGLTLESALLTVHTG